MFLKLLENIHSVRILGKFRNYLLTIAAHTCSNHLKKAKPAYTDVEALEMPDREDTPLEKVMRDETRSEVRTAIDSLPEAQREAVILRVYGDLKIREIAKLTNAAVPTVKSRLRQGFIKLRRYMGDGQGGENA